MCYWTIQEGEQFVRTLSGYTEGFAVVYWNRWSSYEEDGWLVIFQRVESSNGQHYALRGGHCVMDTDPQPEIFAPYAVSDQRALEMIIDMDETVVLMQAHMST